MSTPVHALFVHGVGEQERGFSETAQAVLRSCGVELFAQEAHWAPLADRLETAFLQRAEKRGSRGNLTQRLVVGTLSDALAYQSNARLREEIWDCMDRAFLKLRVDRCHIFAHSLGGLVATDWLRSRNRVECLGLHTFGCNVGLFNLGKKFDCPWQLQDPGTWTSYYDPSDMLGFPLSASFGLAHVRDVKVEVGGWFKSWTGLAHTAYWDDTGFWKTVRARL